MRTAFILFLCFALNPPNLTLSLRQRGERYQRRRPESKPTTRPDKRPNLRHPPGPCLATTYGAFSPSVFGAGDAEPLHFVEQRRASHFESRSRTMRTSDHPIGAPQSLQDVFAFGLRKRSHFRRNVSADTLQLGKWRTKNCIR